MIRLSIGAWIREVDRRFACNDWDEMTASGSIQHRQVDALDLIERLSMQCYSKRLHIRMLESELADIERKRKSTVKELRGELGYVGEIQSDAQLEATCKWRARNAKSVADMIRVVLREHWHENELTTDEIVHAIKLRWKDDKRITRQKVRTNLNRLATGKEMQIQKYGDTWVIPDIKSDGEHWKAFPSPKKIQHRVDRQARMSSKQKPSKALNRPATKSKKRTTANP